jgi:alcohol dehydrogenase (cytochrome c)
MRSRTLPLVVKDKVIVGTAGGDGARRESSRRSTRRLDPKSGASIRFPQPGEPGNETWSGDSWKRGGAAVWNIGAYDPNRTSRIGASGTPRRIGTDDRGSGDNLYSDCVVALDADTGKLKWYYQFTPHDEMDYDAAQVPVLADMPWPDTSGQSQLRKVMLWANRNG